VTLSLVSMLVAAALGEAAVRVICGGKFGPRPAFIVGDNHLGWKPAPNLDDTFYGPDYDIDIRTDADGYRLGARGDVDYTKDLVVLCGDSYAFGWGVSTDQTFASYLDQLLDQESSARARVVNLGVGGYGILQSCDCLEEFFKNHPSAHVRTVLVQHCVNDPADNSRSVGYHVGMWETQNRSKPRSRLHLVNLIAYASLMTGQNRRSQVDVQMNHPYLQDMLESYERKGRWVHYPEQAVIGNQQIKFDVANLKHDVKPEDLLARGQLSRMQSDLMFASLGCIHEACAARGVTVVHTFISTTPDWYVQEVTKLALDSAKLEQCRAVATGRVPRPEAYGGAITNDHSGGHFNGEYNRFWAKAVADVLRDVASPEADPMPGVDSTGAVHR